MTHHESQPQPDKMSIIDRIFPEEEFDDRSPGNPWAPIPDSSGLDEVARALRSRVHCIPPATDIAPTEQVDNIA